MTKNEKDEINMRQTILGWLGGGGVEGDWRWMQNLVEQCW